MDEPMSNRAKFAIIMVGVVILVALGLRIRWYYKPITMPNIFVAEDLDFQEIEDNLFGNETVPIVLGDETEAESKAASVVASERSTWPALQRQESRQLQSGKEIMATVFNDKFVIAIERNDKIVIQEYDKNWEKTGPDEITLDDVAAARRKIIATGDALYVFSMRDTTGRKSLDMKKYDTDYQLSNEIELFNSDFFEKDITVSDWNYFTAVSDNEMTVSVDISEDSTTLLRYGLDGTLKDERIVENLGVVLDLHFDLDNNLIIVSQKDTAAQFTKFDGQGNEVARYAVAMEAENYSLQHFERLSDYLIFMAVPDESNKTFSQLWIWSDNLITRYPAIDFTEIVRSPSLIADDNNIYVVYAQANTIVEEDSEITSYNVKVDSFSALTTNPTSRGD